MAKFPKPIETLIRELGLLPGVGPKTAERYAFALLKRTREERGRLATAIATTDESLVACRTCRNYTEADPCGICSDPKRDRDLICVVATEQDLLSIEATGEYRGLYHILGGNLSPADGVMPDDLTIGELITRVTGGVSGGARPREVLFGLDPTIEGESTMLYLSRMLAPAGVRMTRLARGLPIGSELGYADEVTLTDAIRGRRDMPQTAARATEPAGETAAESAAI